MLLTSLLAVMSIVPAPAPALSQGTEGKRETLEQLLVRARAQRDAQLARWADQVKDLVAKLEPAARSRSAADGERALGELVGLGSEATPLLVPYLDPGATPQDVERFRASRVALALSRMDITPVVDTLIARLTASSDEGRRNVLRVLETTSERERVRPHVLALFQTSQGAVRQSALRTLFSLGGDNQELVSQVLLGEDTELTRLALRALTESRNTALLDQFDRLLSDPKKVAPVIGEVLSFLHKVPEAARDNEIRLLIQLAGNTSDLEVEPRLAILDALPDLSPRLPADSKRSLEGLSQARDRRVREAALVAMVCSGDRSARKTLLADYDERIKKNDRWAPAYAERAAVLYRIRDYDAAAKDYLQALANGRNDPTARPDLHIGLARCYAMLGKLKEASEVLDNAPIAFAELEKLAEDPTFAKLKDHPRYGSIFRRK